MEFMKIHQSLMHLSPACGTQDGWVLSRHSFDDNHQHMLFLWKKKKDADVWVVTF